MDHGVVLRMADLRNNVPWK